MGGYLGGGLPRGVYTYQAGQNSLLTDALPSALQLIRERERRCENEFKSGGNSTSTLVYMSYVALVLLNIPLSIWKLLCWFYIVCFS